MRVIYVVLCVYIYTIFFPRLCICVYSYIYLSLCLSLSLSPCPPLPSCLSDLPSVLTLASTYGVGMGKISAREEMRDRINEGRRGHHQRKNRMRVWILFVSLNLLKLNGTLNLTSKRQLRVYTVARNIPLLTNYSFLKMSTILPVIVILCNILHIKLVNQYMSRGSKKSSDVNAKWHATQQEMRQDWGGVFNGGGKMFPG